MTATTTRETLPTEDLLGLWSHIFNDQRGFIGLFSGVRIAGIKELQHVWQAFFAWPATASNAADWLREQASRPNREVYFCAHLLNDRKRVAVNAAPVLTLYVDGDGAKIPASVPRPTAVVASSPGREHFYWRLTEPIAPAQAQQLNTRLALAIGADPSGADLSQLLRAPGLPNRKYAGEPITTLTRISGDAWTADELNTLLPPLPAGSQREATSTETGDDDEPPVRLGTVALKWWNGTYWHVADDGDVDRSRTLFEIGRQLWHAGATERTIAAALLERDVTLGHGKYVEHSDPDRASKDARKVIAKMEAEPPFTNDAHAAAPASADLTACHDHVAVLERQLLGAHALNDQLQARTEYLECRLSRVMTVLYNPGLKPAEALIALNMVNVLDEKAATGRAGDDGFARVYLDELTKPTHTYVDPATGEIIETRKYHKDLEKIDKGSRSVSKATASRYLEKFESWGLIERKYEDHFSSQSGPITELYLRLPATATETVDRLATIDPRREIRHGGSLPKAQRPAPRPFQCAEHPDAGVLVKRMAECAECHAPLGTLPDELLAADAPFQDETVERTPSSVSSLNVPMVNNLKQDTELAPIHVETEMPRCPNCQRLLVDAEDRKLGRCSYRCNLQATWPAVPSGVMYAGPALGGGE